MMAAPAMSPNEKPMREPLTSRTIRVNGLDLYVATAGDGPGVLLLHGFPDTHAVWRRQIPALVEAGYRVIAPDLRGFGASEMPNAVSAYAVEQLVADMVGILDALGIERVRVVAHDWGAIVGWLLCIRFPERVDRLAALSVGHPGAYVRGGPMQKLKGWYVLFFQLRGIAERLLPLGNWWLVRTWVGQPDELLRWRAALSRPGRLRAALNLYRANQRLFVRCSWPRVRVPVLGIWSSRDVALAERQMIQSARWVDAPWRYERIDGASHWPQLDVPERVNPLLIDFLR